MEFYRKGCEKFQERVQSFVYEYSRIVIPYKS